MDLGKAAPCNDNPDDRIEEIFSVLEKVYNE
jgi:hypothetical protein